MKIAVIDTSALIRFYIPDGPVPANLEKTIELASNGEALALIPELALVEATQVLWKKQSAKHLSPHEVDAILTLLLNLPLTVIGHRDFITNALSLARKFSLTVYDSLFLSMAKHYQAELISADQALLSAYAGKL